MAVTRKNRFKRVKIPASVVLAFMDKNHDFLPTVENYGDYTTKEEIYRVRVTLWHEKKRLDLYKALVKEHNIPSITEATLEELVAATTQKKYRERASPPFTANKLCGATLHGNDKKFYISEKTKAGTCMWIQK